MRKIFWITGFLLICQAAGSVQIDETPWDYGRLLAFIQLEERDAPLYLFKDLEREMDEDSLQSDLSYFRHHPGLLRKIQEDLDGEPFGLRIKAFEERLLFIPELRREYARLYERYCNHLVTYILQETQLTNPFNEIRTLTGKTPQIPENGVTVFLVHNLEKEYTAEYCFFNGYDKKVVIELTGKIELGRVGSYGSTLTYGDNGEIEFTRDTYTIWQNTAANPYTALTVPAEETLHVSLRAFTEDAILNDLKHRPIRTPGIVEKIVQEWITVEEAVVGGIVHSLVKKFLGQYLPGILPGLVQKDLKTKGGFKRYALLKNGMDVVRDMGPRTAVKIYSETPWEFKRLLKSGISRKQGQSGMGRE